MFIKKYLRQTSIPLNIINHLNPLRIEGFYFLNLDPVGLAVAGNNSNWLLSALPLKLLLCEITWVEVMEPGSRPVTAKPHK